jgi:hypothetical protein
MHSHTCHCTQCIDRDAALRAFARGDYVTYSRWLKQQDSLRIAGSRGSLRVGIHHHQEDDKMEHDYAPVDGYASALKARAASETQTPAEHLAAFEEQWKAARLRDLDAEHAETDAHLAPTSTPRLPTAELAEFKPPNPYEAGIKALREKERR